MNTEILGSVATVAALLALSLPLGKYLAKIYAGERTFTDFLAPAENLMFRFCGVKPRTETDWKTFLKDMLAVNALWFALGMILLALQGALPLNPDGNAGQTPDLAFNTCISFLVNCNLQHYSGESGLTYLTQLGVVMFFQFVTAATGMAALAGVFRAMSLRRGNDLGDFRVYLVRSCTRVLIPLALAVGALLIVSGTPMSFDGKETVTTLEGAEQVISQGPAAAVIPIKQLGTNGGGYFGCNSAHPLENPSFLTNIVEAVSILLIPAAMVWAFGFYLKRKKLALTIFLVMLVPVLVGLGFAHAAETGGNPALDALGIDQSAGATEGKETRLGAAATALWSVFTTATSNGSVNGMHGSTMPASALVEMLNMQVNCWFGGAGVGFLNYYAFIIVAAFIGGLMVGRAPEFLGKKIEAREMKLAMLVALLHPFLILTGTAVAAASAAFMPDLASAWLNNPSCRGFSEMLYEFTSAAANNGSGFEGLGDNTPFWNISTGVVLILSRYLPIIGTVAIAGLLARKRFAPESAGTLRTDTGTFAFLTFSVIAVVAALSFFPALALGPIAEWLSL